MNLKAFVLFIPVRKCKPPAGAQLHTIGLCSLAQHNESPHTSLTPLYLHPIFRSSARHACFGSWWKRNVQVCAGSTERCEREGVQNQQAGGERAAAANDALICPESPDDERGKGVHFID